MNKLLLLFFVTLLAGYTRVSAQQKFYYSDNRKYYVEQDSNTIYVRLKNNDLRKSYAATQRGTLRFDTLINKEVLAVHKIAGRSRASLLEEVKKDTNVIYAYTAMHIGGLPLIPTGDILLKLKPGVAIQSALSRNALSKIKIKSQKWPEIDIPEKDRIKDQVAPIIVLSADQDSAFDIANRLYESGAVEYCHPDFYVPITHQDKHDISVTGEIKIPNKKLFRGKRTPLLPNDPAYMYQFYLNPSGSSSHVNIDSARFYYQYATMSASIIDDGVEAHEDLYGTPTGYTPTTGATGTSGGIPMSPSAGHGQSCAGIFGAITDNGIGIASVAGKTDFRTINIFHGAATISHIASGMWYAYQGASTTVITNSWAFETYNPVGFDAIATEITNARTLGYYGNGTVVVFAAGNSTTSNPSLTVRYPANVPGVLTVGACTSSGGITTYSCRGPEMDVVALGEFPIQTIDRMGANGYNAGDYNSGFDGTSAAAPQAAALVAILRACEFGLQPRMREDSIRWLITSNATDLGTAGFDNTFGYGRINVMKSLVALLKYRSYVTPYSDPQPTYRDYAMAMNDPYSTAIPSIPAGYRYNWSFSNANATLSVTPFTGTVGQVVRVNKVASGSGVLTCRYGPVKGEWITKSITVNLGSTVQIVAGPVPALNNLRLVLEDKTNTSKAEELQIQSVELYDRSGRLLKSVQQVAPGTSVYNLNFSGLNLPYGEYFVNIRSRTGEILKKAVMLGGQSL